MLKFTTLRMGEILTLLLLIQPFTQTVNRLTAARLSRSGRRRLRHINNGEHKSHVQAEEAHGVRMKYHARRLRASVLVPLTGVGGGGGGRVRKDEIIIAIDLPPHFRRPAEAGGGRRGRGGFLRTQSLCFRHQDVAGKDTQRRRRGNKRQRRASPRLAKLKKRLSRWQQLLIRNGGRKGLM